MTIHCKPTSQPRLSFLVVGFLATVISATAAVSIINPAGNIIDWDDGTQWSTGLEPNASDDVLINQQKTANVTTTGNQALSALVGNTIGNWNPSYLNVKSGGGLTLGSLTLANVNAGADEGIVNIETGGSLINTGDLVINSAGTLNVSGGAYTSTNSGARVVSTGGGVINVSSGSFIAQGSAATHLLTLRTSVNITGGVFDLSGGQVIFGNSPTVTITGDAATVTMDRLNTTAAGRDGTIQYIFNASGISTIAADASFVNLDQLTILIDGSAYAGGPGTFTLITASNISNDFSTSNLTVTGLGDEGTGWNWLADMDGSGGDSLAIQVVPEPSVVAIYFGLFALGLVSWRRRSLK
ncbi:hypothetical protein G0Q06_06435 [Puniceicoccales bacterium CK1056]|uniref:PEP-CTERM protein-sorting domain-containing protein n=1 Tax=Oceanipulchritudo coccoides TaxID=2706888 RepID=A0A6B2LZI9_9BACT|nr:hypothetical protein [Oceanipulchritudo coccoides]NDV62078.1 hypothetical protein [Oceanipulchritudo coccoides]